MSTIVKYALFIAVTVWSFSMQAQSQNVQTLFQEAEQLDDLGLYGECLQKLDQIIAITEGRKDKTEFLEASIMKAETFRKTERFRRGLSILKELQNTEAYPELHVKKLGRIAAINRQDDRADPDIDNDSIQKILNEAIRLTKRYNFRLEEAALRNELGYMQSQIADQLGNAGELQTEETLFQKAERNLKIAADIFRREGDTENELWVMRNILVLKVWKGEFDAFNSIYPEVVEQLEGKNWYQLQSGIFGLIANVKMTEGDSSKGYYWRDLAHGSTAAFHAKKNSAQMAAFTNLHDTQRFKKEAIRKQAALDRQQYELNQYIFFSIILLLLVLLGGVILVRERRLKRKLNRNVEELNVLNDKYEMLLVESNHRIKNNLQMIISMLEFTKKGVEHSKSDIIQSISGKIQTISTLHKHLYLDMHNAHVDLKFYFSELIEQYRQMEVKFEIHAEIEEVQIRSERIVYFGLILNEMISNSLEHGKPGGQPILIAVKAVGDSFVFEYCDHSPHDESAAPGTGLQLIKGLVSRIGGKKYTLNKETGTYRFYFETESSKAMMAS
ncbi:MAG: sensor histidine kinase [Fluviicola sp.]